MKRYASALMGALALSLVLSAPAFAQYPPEEPSCGVSDTTLAAGDQVTVSGQNWQPGSTVSFTLQPEGEDLGSTTVGGNGNFSATLTIPNSVSSGTHSIECDGVDVEGATVVLSSNITVSVGGTAFTGASISLGLLLLAGLLIVGVLALAAGRRKARIAARS